MPDFGFACVPGASRFRLANATVPAILVDGAAARGSGLLRRDIVVADGRIAAIEPAGTDSSSEPMIDLDGGMVLPGFLDMHTHLDKGHISPRRPNPDGSFTGALSAAALDRTARWTADDIARRMDFSLRCAHAHGTVAIRTHLDSAPPQDAISWPVFAEARQHWRGRIALQAVALMGIDQLLDAPTLEGVAKRAKDAGGLIGGAMAAQPRMDEAIRAVVAAATRHELDIDLHLDETQAPRSNALRLLAETVLETGFGGRVTAGHCCSLARQDTDEARRTIDLVAKAGIAIVALPLCNLYLQDRGNGTTTPRFRGVTLLREFSAAGVTVVAASDNIRDPFYAYGDLDPLEVLRETVRIGHLDHPLEDAPALVTRNAARVMGLDAGTIAVGRPADLVLLRGRDWSEVLSRPEERRTVLREGRPIDRTLPDYRELDDLMEA